MSATIQVDPQAPRSEQYRDLIAQLEHLCDPQDDLISNLGNLMAALREGMGYHWVGLYRVVEDELLLYIFQGPVACLRIGLGKGVCGTSWQENRSIVVPDVDAFPGHIACSSLSRSELVLPVRYQGNVVMVLDIDSAELNYFSETDVEPLEKVVALIEKLYANAVTK